MVLAIWCGSAGADVTPDLEYSKYVNQSSAVQPLGEAPFGEQISLLDGSISFRQTDIELLGKGPAIRITRTTGVTEENKIFENFGFTLYDWVLEVPRVKTMTPVHFGGRANDPKDWQIFSDTPYARCTQFFRPKQMTYEGDAYAPPWEPEDWWNGYQLVDMAGASHALLRADTRTINGANYSIATKSDWRVGCLPQTANGQPGEAFIGLSSDGTRYWFNHLVYSLADTLVKPLERPNFARSTSGGVTPFGVFESVSLGRRYGAMLVTRIEDRFGNYVTYNYTNDKLTSISASDGRLVTVSYNAGYIDITAVTADTPNRTWRYVGSNGRLTDVINPDGSRWTFALGQFTRAPTLNPPHDMGGGSCSSPYPVDGRTAAGSITAPSGLTGTFSIASKKHGRSYVYKQCWNNIPGTNDSGYALYPRAWYAYALTSRTLTGPGLQPQTWTYSYSPPNDSWEHECPTPTSCPSTIWTSVTDPSGGVERYTFSNRINETETLLLKQETFPQGSSTPIRTTINSYPTIPPGSAWPYNWPEVLGDPLMNRQNIYPLASWIPLTRKEIHQDGVTMVWQSNGFDDRARPLSVTKSSSLGYSRTDATAYYDDMSKWVLGQVASSTNTNTGKIESRTEFWPDTVLPKRTYAFEKPVQSMTYYADGTLATVADGNNNTTTFSGWKRGIPQTIKYPATPESPTGATESAIVNDAGWITAVTDENGYTTTHGYDAMGRLTSTAYPTADSTDWDVTERSFEQVNEDEYGLAAGHWRETEYIDDYTKVVYYDALWRPVVEQEEDATNDAGTLRWRNTRYDHAGRVVFASYLRNPYVDGWADHTGAPMDEPLVTPMAGTYTAYDVLGRVIQAKQDSELGQQLTTTTQYLPGLLTQITNPRNQSAITGYMAYDQPTYDWPVSVSHPEGVYTDILRDVFGKLKTLTRRNANSSLQVQRHLVYDSHQQLCKSIEPETGTTLYKYDNAGNLIRTEFGMPAWPPSACDEPAGMAALNDPPQMAPYALRTYDARNRLKTLTFPDHNGDQTWTYTPDGLPKKIVTVNSGGDDTAVNEYFYNKRRLLTAETLGQPDWYTWQVDYDYNGKGQLAGQGYPNGLYVDYDVNALGQPTRAGDFATGVQYYPNGSIKQFTYGNGIVHTMTQNARQLPARSIDSGAINFDMRFDANGNVTQIYDLARGSAYDRQMQYDGLDRLTAAASTSFGGDGWHRFTYNALDNLTSWKLAGVKDYASYYYEPGTNRLTNILNTSGASVVGMSYDAQGNLWNKNGVDFDFDYGNRLREVVDKEGYHYDGHGRRILSWRPDDGLDFSLYGQSGQLWYQEYDAKALAVENVYLAGSLIATYEYNWNADTFVTKYHHTDALGSPVAVTNAAGQVTDRTDWEPYGAAIGKPTYEGIGFTGHVHDAATKLTYMQQRYYDPAIGRFLSMDPVTAYSSGDWRHFNGYAYGFNNPYTMIDPDGRDPQAMAYWQAWDKIKAFFNSPAGVEMVYNAGTLMNAASITRNSRTAAMELEVAGVAMQNARQMRAAAALAREAHGNSAASTRLQHRYVIRDESGDAVKTGISGGTLNQNGSSGRANRQVNTLNRAEGPGSYTAEVVETNIPGRAAALSSERTGTQELRQQGNTLRLQQRPKPEGE